MSEVFATVLTIASVIYVLAICWEISGDVLEAARWLWRNLL